MPVSLWVRPTLCHRSCDAIFAKYLGTWYSMVWRPCEVGIADLFQGLLAVSSHDPAVYVSWHRRQQYFQVTDYHDSDLT